MFKNHFKAKVLLDKKTPKELGLEYISVKRIELKGSVILNTKEEEVCLVIIDGKINFRFEYNKSIANFKDMLYIPRRKTIQINSDKGIIIYFSVPTNADSKFSHIKFTDINKNKKTHKSFGKSEKNSKREVWKFIDNDFECARLMVGLCESSIGGWTAWPPHEHAEKREEVYLFFNMGNNFGVQCVYEDMNDLYTAEIVRDGDLISIPRGYHPNVGAPGGKISYIYCMASKKIGDRNFMDLNIQRIYGNSFE